LDLDNFLDLMIAELQNQDPLDPMDNSEILQQINTIREISATNELSDTLAAVLTGQNLSTASSLIGKSVDALTDSGENIQGVVDRVSVEVSEDDDSIRELRVHVGDNNVRLNNVREINEGPPA
jgi:flagellar basal-body rod modification protein FlgD